MKIESTFWEEAENARSKRMKGNRRRIIEVFNVRRKRI
jgi:hypothetical protein